MKHILGNRQNGGVRTAFLAFAAVVILLAIVSATALFHFSFGQYHYFLSATNAANSVANLPASSTPEEAKSVYVRFDMEAYDLIKQNYWNVMSDADLATLFQAAAGKVTGKTQSLPTEDRVGTAQMLFATFAASAAPSVPSVSMIGADTGTDSQSSTNVTIARQIAINIVAEVLYNLRPNGRSGLDSTAQVTALRQEVSNINPSANLYNDLGVSTTSSDMQIKQAYHAQVATLAASTSPEAPLALKQVTYAYKVLSNTNSKELYDHNGIEPTVFSHVVGHTLYIYIKKMSPATAQEFVWTVDAASTTPGLSSMIIDLRGNIGGEPPIVQGLAGFFLGQNQYAFDFYHQGTYEAQRTIFGKFPELDRYREVALLVDSLTQSSAEITAEVLTHFHIAHSVGTTTAGWGTIENTYPLQTVIDPANKYSLLLVNSITLRDDGQPIQGLGITPDVDVTALGWQNRLSDYFFSPDLIRAVKQTVTVPPKEI